MRNGLTLKVCRIMENQREQHMANKWTLGSYGDDTMQNSGFLTLKVQVSLHQTNVLSIPVFLPSAFLEVVALPEAQILLCKIKLQTVCKLQP